MLTASSPTNRMETWTGRLSSAVTHHYTMVWKRFTLAQTFCSTKAYSFDPKNDPYKRQGACHLQHGP